MATRVILADDHAIMRQGLRALMDRQKGIEVVGETGDGHATVRMAARLNPDVVVMDVGMPNLNGIEAARQILAANGRAKIVALSAHGDRRYVTEMLRAGASAYILKDSAAEELMAAIRAVMQGHTYLSPQIADAMVEVYRRLPTERDASAFTLLSEREREVLQLLAEGKSTKEAAAVLGVSAKTVATHREHIMEKLRARSVAELVRYALREGLTSLEAGREAHREEDDAGR